MAYVIAEPCIDVLDISCVSVCPVDCIHYEEGTDRKLFIDPNECIDCGACEPECPVNAIFPEESLPSEWAKLHDHRRDLVHGQGRRARRRRRGQARGLMASRGSASRVGACGSGPRRGCQHAPRMRIVSLLPSATEIVCAIGLGDELVGVTHECDWPPEVIGKPVMTRSVHDLTERRRATSTAWSPTRCTADPRSTRSMPRRSRPPSRT